MTRGEMAEGRISIDEQGPRRRRAARRRAARSLAAMGADRWASMTRRRFPPTLAALLFLASGARGAPGEACQGASSDGLPGYLVEIRLCSADSPRCKPGAHSTYRARRAALREMQTFSIPEIPDGYVISGGELFSSVYDLATRGFANVSLADHGDPGDYCSRHSFFEMGADWTGDDATDAIDVDVCVRYAKWSGPPPATSCRTDAGAPTRGPSDRP
jgi:hypothetical protein